MKELDFKTEYQKLVSARDDVYKRLLTDLPADMLKMCREIIDRNENYLYGETESPTTHHKCFNAICNALRVLTRSNEETIRRIFNYAGIYDTVKILAEEDDAKAYESEGEESELVFIFSDNDAMYFSIYDYRLYDYSLPGESINKLKKAMKNKGFTAAGLSNVSKVSVRTIENYMSGHRNIANAKSEIVLALADALRVNVSDLI